jgi:hypothetical protein
VALGFDYTLFGTTYNNVYVNTNGNVSFNAGISTYNPQGPLGSDEPIISAWFGDVDTRNVDSGLVKVRLDANQLIVTWDDVGYFRSNADKKNSFQMVIRGDNYVVPVGEGTVGFWWKNMPWEQNDTSTTAAIAFGTGTLGDGFVLDGSNTAGLNTQVANHHIWFNTNGGTVVVAPPDVSAVPEPETYALMLGGLALVGAFARRRKPV